jgi:hypothetical protein
MRPPDDAILKQTGGANAREFPGGPFRLLPRFLIHFKNNLGGLRDMNSNKKSMMIKCEEVPGIKTPFGSEVKMLMHPALQDLDRDVSVLWVTLPPEAAAKRPSKK